MKKLHGFRVLLIIGVYVIGVIYFYLLKRVNFFIFWPAFCFILVFVVSSLMTFLNGRSHWWYMCIISFVLLLTAPFTALVVMSFLEVKTKTVSLSLLISLPITACFVLRWIWKTCDDEVVSEAISSHRFDVKEGVFSLFPFFHSVMSIAQQKIGRLFIPIAITGNLFILISMMLLGAHWTGLYRSEGYSMGMMISFYFFSLIVLSFLGLLLREYSWIRKWEKQHGRRMHISYAQN